MTDTDNLDATAPAPEVTTTEATTEAKAEVTTETIATGSVAEKPVAAPADWPDDWRNKFAGEDKAHLKQLERFASPNDVFKSYRALQARISSGELKSALPKDQTPEALATWRKENGIPEKPEEYDLALDDGLVIGEQDKPLVGEFLNEMHAANASPAAVKSALSAYYKLVAKQQAELIEADSNFRDESETALREEWGGEFRKNVNLVTNLLASAPEDVRLKIEAGRTPEGRKLGDDPAVLRWLANLSREVNPAATVVPGSGNNSGAAIDDEISTIEKAMGDQSSEYWKGPKPDGKDTKMQIRYRELITARDKIKARQ